MSLCRRKKGSVRNCAIKGVITDENLPQIGTERKGKAIFSKDFSAKRECSLNVYTQKNTFYLQLLFVSNIW